MAALSTSAQRDLESQVEALVASTRNAALGAQVVWEAARRDPAYHPVVFRMSQVTRQLIECMNQVDTLSDMMETARASRSES